MSSNQIENICFLKLSDNRFTRASPTQKVISALKSQGYQSDCSYLPNTLPDEKKEIYLKIRDAIMPTYSEMGHCRERTWRFQRDGSRQHDHAFYHCAAQYRGSNAMPSSHV